MKAEVPLKPVCRGHYPTRVCSWPLACGQQTGENAQQSPGSSGWLPRSPGGTAKGPVRVLQSGAVGLEGERGIWPPCQGAWGRRSLLRPVGGLVALLSLSFFTGDTGFTALPAGEPLWRPALPALLLPCCVTLGTLLHLSVPRFPGRIRFLWLLYERTTNLAA